MLFYNAVFLLCIVSLYDQLPSGVGESFVLYFSVAAVLCLLGLVGTIKVRHRAPASTTRPSTTMNISASAETTTGWQQLTDSLRTAIANLCRHLRQPCPS